MTGSRAVIVTGGGSGIGRATARAFAEHGDRVLVVGRTRSALIGTATGYDAIYPLVVDITDSGAPQAIAESARQQLGGVDILVNNAATGSFGALGQLNRALVEAQVATNLVAPILVTQAMVEALEATSGVIVNVSSAGALGLRSWPGNAVYGATKVGLDLLTRSWAVELGPRGIRVVGVAPGVINSGVGVRTGMSPQDYAHFLDRMRAEVPLGRVGEPAEVAWWILQLASPAASYAHGAVFALDGALSVT
jgi:C-7 ketoreductase